jgi:hypothetical protein
MCIYYAIESFESSNSSFQRTLISSHYWDLIFQIANVTEDGVRISQPYALKPSWNFKAFKNPSSSTPGSWWTQRRFGRRTKTNFGSCYRHEILHCYLSVKERRSQFPDTSFSIVVGRLIAKHTRWAYWIGTLRCPGLKVFFGDVDHEAPRKPYQ